MGAGRSKEVLPSRVLSLTLINLTMLWSPEALLISLVACGFAITSYFVYSSGQLFVQIPNTPGFTKHAVKAAFEATRLTASTFLIKEYDDIYSEHPHIYAKVVPEANTVLLIDSGCGGASNNSDIQITSLREFIEKVGLSDNEGKPLNEDGKMKYVVVTTHCHYDHILGIEHFKDSPILASSHSPAFLKDSQLPENSLCNALGIKMPSYTPTLVPHLHVISSPEDKDALLDVTVLHTPGHTPDELALYDENEMMLYVGDSLYEYEPIIFPKEGSIVEWFTSMDYLISFVQRENRLQHKRGESCKREVLINAGHSTAVKPALNVLLAAKAYMQDVISGEEPVKERMQMRGEETVVYGETGDRFSLRCPERLVLEAARRLGLV
ncbi:beta-lactamase-like protein [Crucibulum laeve]|uniref:Beta-lactamase-like protein n=1 Tax=Crucibulum laeve TaxID=68775 RepID=A0A5C3M8Y8_9AGAR|nr:beta-lactamase-like protein [Crucibulum laeve]